MRYYILLLLSSLLSIQTFAQTDNCGTKITAEQMEFMNKISQIKSNRSAREMAAIIDIPLKLHVVRQSNGQGGITQNQLTNAIAKLNTFYENSNIRFFQLDDINFIDNDEFFDFDSSDEGKLAVPNDVSRVINVYFFNSITTQGSALCGYTRFPPSEDRVFMANGCTTSGNTFAHELGHYFTLFHTHGVTNTGTTDELVNGSNCTGAGDRLCDTPADPNLSGVVNGSCQYTGSARDANGDYFNPMVSNIMSYAPGSCRTLFTAGQYDRIRSGFENGRSYLNFTTDDFTIFFNEDRSEICVGSQVKFEAISFGAQSYSWTFEGGTPATSTNQNPIVTYNSPGMFTVSVTATNGAGETATFEKTAYIMAEDPLANSTTSIETSSFNTIDLPSSWEIENPDLAFTFEVIEGIDANDDPGSNAMFVNNFQYANEVPRNEDILRFPSYNVNGVRGYTVKFDYAYTYRRGFGQDVIPDVHDSIAIVLNNGCEVDNLTIFEKGGAELATAPAIDTEYFPSPGEWSTINVYHERTDANAEFGILELHNISYNGNNMFFDNLEVIPDYGVNSPLNLKLVSTTSSSLDIQWTDNSINETSFTIYKSVDGGAFIEAGSVNEDITTFTDTDIQNIVNSVEYYVVAEGVNSNASEASVSLILDTSQITSIEELEISSKDISIWPNPTYSEFYIDTKEYVSSFRILDVFGKEVLSGEFSNNKVNKIEARDLKSGVYLVILSGKDKTITKRIVKY